MEKNPKTEDLTFQIIFTQGSVKYMRLFTLSLLKWRPCSFRLVANDCDFKETEMLRRFCRNSSRLEYFPLPSKGRLSHADALNFLQKREESRYFCFMDSDILATGPFLSEIPPLMQNHCAVFSGRPVWLEKGQNIMPTERGDGKRFRGQFNTTGDGYVSGSSFFAIYDNSVLNDFIDATGIGFNRFNWLHIPPVPLTRRIINVINKTRRLLSAREETPNQNDETREDRLKIKRAVNHYFMEYLHALFENRSLPQPPAIDNPRVLREVEAISEHINEYYREYRTRL